MFFFRLLLRILLLVVVFVTIGLGIMFYSDLKQLGEGYYAYYRGNLAYKNRNYDQALDYYNQALHAFPDTTYVYTRIGDSYLRLNNPQEAITHYKKALEIDPNSTRALAKLARAEWIMGHEQVALGLYYDALQSHPDNAQLRASMGDLYLSKAKETQDPKYYEKAIAALERALDKEKNDSNAFTRVKLAESYYAQGEYEQNILIMPKPCIHWLRLLPKTGPTRKPISTWEKPPN
jgi:tetratricopeptide (TPR) repeat protein